jgi:hypothetical protein
MPTEIGVEIDLHQGPWRRRAQKCGVTAEWWPPTSAPIHREKESGQVAVGPSGR